MIEQKQALPWRAWCPWALCKIVTDWIVRPFAYLLAVGMTALAYHAASASFCIGVTWLVVAAYLWVQVQLNRDVRRGCKNQGDFKKFGWHFFWIILTAMLCFILLRMGEAEQAGYTQDLLGKLRLIK